MYGEVRSLVDSSKLTDEVWDVIFLGIVKFFEDDFLCDLLDCMINEFNFWYLFDFCVLGKDLI